MNIGIDARFVGPQGTGLGKYTEKLIINLAQIDKKNSYFLFLKKSNWDFLKVGKNFKKIPADINWYSLEEQIKLPQIFNSQNLDLLHIPHFNVPIFYKKKFIVTIHDLIHHSFAENSVSTRNWPIFQIKRFAYKYVIRGAIRKSEKIICPSNFTKSRIMGIFGVDSDKIVVTYEAAEDEYFKNTQKPQSQKIIKKYNIKVPFIIYVGNAYPHKNLERLLAAVKIVNQEGLKVYLVIVSARDAFWERLKREVVSKDLVNMVIMTDYIPAWELSVIFRNASAYVFPSLSEGFGIPGLNAMAAEIPVVASDISPLAEIYGEGALYFDPGDVDDIAVKIKNVLLDNKLRSDLVKRGVDQVKKYSWKKMAKETLGVYESV